MKVVVDTSVIIDYLRGGLVWNNFLDDAKKNTSLFLPTIVIFELFGGKSTHDPQEEQNITTFIKQFKQIKLDEKTAKRAGELFRDFGRTLQAPDYIIASSALEIGGMILTLNKKHFERIPNLDLYEL